METEISAAASSSHKAQAVAEHDPSKGRPMMPCCGSARTPAFEVGSRSSPARQGGQTGAATFRGHMVMIWLRSSMLQMKISKVGGYVWAVDRNLAGAPNQGIVCRRREEMLAQALVAAPSKGHPGPSARPVPAGSTTACQSWREGGTERARSASGRKRAHQKRCRVKG